MQEGKETIYRRVTTAKTTAEKASKYVQMGYQQGPDSTKTTEPCTDGLIPCRTKSRETARNGIQNCTDGLPMATQFKRGGGNDQTDY